MKDTDKRMKNQVIGWEKISDKGYIKNRERILKSQNLAVKKRKKNLAVKKRKKNFKSIRTCTKDTETFH